jgi:hypothetical protein
MLCQTCGLLRKGSLPKYGWVIGRCEGCFSNEEIVASYEDWGFMVAGKDTDEWPDDDWEDDDE